MTISKPNYLTKALPANSIILGIRASTNEFWGGRNIQFIILLEWLKFKSWPYQVLLRMWCHWNSNTLIVKMQCKIITATLGKNLATSYTVKHTFTLRPSDITSRYFPNRNESIYSHRSVNSNIYKALLTTDKNWSIYQLVSKQIICWI